MYTFSSLPNRLFLSCVFASVFLAVRGLSPTAGQAQKKKAETASRLAHEQAVMKVAAQVNPAVVQIAVDRLGERFVQPTPFQGTPFEGYFDEPDQETESYYESGLGSGVIVNSNGFIVTNSHVLTSPPDRESQIPRIPDCQNPRLLANEFA